MHQRAFGRPSGVEGAVGVHGDVSVQRGVLFLDSIQRGLDDLDGGQGAGCDQARQLGRGRLEGNCHVESLSGTPEPVARRLRSGA